MDSAGHQNPKIWASSFLFLGLINSFARVSARPMGNQYNRLKISALAVALTVLSVLPGRVFGAGGEGGASEVSEVIMHHVTDDHVWHFADGLVMPLPVIIYSETTGLQIFSSGNFFDAEHNLVPYKIGRAHV